MRARVVLAVMCAGVVAAAAWFGRAVPQPPLKHWEPVAGGVFRTAQSPFSYALVSGKSAVLIDATAPPESLAELGVEKVSAVLLTHHHRDTAAFASAYRKAGVPVRASKDAAEWLTPEAVTKFWRESIPLRSSRTGFFVLPEGVPGVDCTLEENKPITAGEWKITPLFTPGHSRDHMAFHAHLANYENGPLLLFCGDAFYSRGKMWTPYTTDWDHWTDAGLKPAAESLRKMAKVNPTHLLPAHGPVVTKDIAAALTDTAAAVDEAGFLKSFERFSKRLGDPPTYPFLVPKEQIASGGDKPWARVSDHLWITGNTYVLKSKTGDGCLVLDPWGQRSADQIEKLRRDEKLGPVEVVAFSHAHYDHFDGLYLMANRDRCQVWGLDLVAGPLKEPFRFRAPFLDARPIRFTKELRDGDSAAWGGYQFKFHHLPGQSWFTCGIEATIDGKRCVFTADNFFHQDQFSGSGGWMGLNRSSPAVYGLSAKKVWDLAPEWVLAEHGGPYVFDAEDYRRRVKWGEAAGRACDALCVSGSHLRDWTPHRVTAEPHLQTAKPGDTVAVRLAVTGTTAETVSLTVQGRGVFADQSKALIVVPGQAAGWDVSVKLPVDVKPGRHVFAVRSTDSHGPDGVDAYFVVETPGP